jgi:hypothetical protein
VENVSELGTSFRACRNWQVQLPCTLAKRRKHGTDVFTGKREKCIEKENVCFEEARRESIKENEKKVVDMSHDVCV